MERNKVTKVLADYRRAIVTIEHSDAIAALNSKLSEVNHVLRDLAPDLPLISASNLGQHWLARKVLDKAEAILNAWEMIDQALIGGSPSLPLMMLDR